MSENSKIISYTKDEMKILWEPKKCIHAGVCVRSLPKVYNPKARPWVKPENASIEELKKQIDQCPSGALSYEMETPKDDSKEELVGVEILKGGPLLVRGNLQIKHTDGSIEEKGKQAAFCRCGHSMKQPYCDGSHKKSSFSS